MNQLNGLITSLNIPLTRINPVRIASSQTYTPSTGTVGVYFEAQAGGGAGGGAIGSTSTKSAGCGGAGGGYAAGYFTKAQIGNSISITIGAGGVGAVGASGVAVNSGGTTSVGSLLSATGGAGGIIRDSANIPKVGLYSQGGLGSGGTINLRGGCGFPCFTFNTAGAFQHSASGGNGLYGLGGAAAQTTALAAGNSAAANTGAGGGSAYNNATSATGVVGGSGGSGIVIAWEFINSLALTPNMLGLSPQGIIYGTKTTIISATSTWIPDANMGYALIKVQGPGGTGAACASTVSGQSNASNGGGGGGFAMSFFTKAQVDALASKALTLTSASTLAFDLITCNRGSPGSATTAGTSGGVPGAVGGSASGGNLVNLKGGNSSPTSWVTVARPAYSSGGNGFGGVGGGTDGAAGAALTGGGGSGQVAINVQSVSATAAGSGYVEIIEYLVRA